MSAKGKYQLFDPLTDEERGLLEQDILEHGIQIPIEYDEDGNVLDGHTRMSIAEKHGLEYPYEIRKFKTEEEKVGHVLMLNMARRQLKPHQWGGAFKRLLELRGVKRVRGRPTKDVNCETVSQLTGDLGVDRRTAYNRMDQHTDYQKLPAKEKLAVDAGEKTVTSASRKQKQGELRKAAAKTAELKGLYSVVMGDPAWKYGASTVTGGADQHYACMELSEICAVPVKDHVTENSACFLWVTPPMLPDGLTVLKAWGFKYKTCIVWVKDKSTKGLGVYVLGQHELLLIGTHGSMVPAVEDRAVSVVHHDVGKHSEKPEVFYEIVERMFPDQKYLEVFARRKRKGWKSWGAEA